MGCDTASTHIYIHIVIVSHASSTDNLGSPVLNIHSVYYCLFYFVDISNH